MKDIEMGGGFKEKGEDVQHRQSQPRRPSPRPQDHCLDLLSCRPWSGGYSVDAESMSALDCFSDMQGNARILMLGEVTYFEEAADD